MSQEDSTRKSQKHSPPWLNVPLTPHQLAIERFREAAQEPLSRLWSGQCTVHDADAVLRAWVVDDARTHQTPAWSDELFNATMLNVAQDYKRRHGPFPISSRPVAIVPLRPDVVANAMPSWAANSVISANSNRLGAIGSFEKPDLTVTRREIREPPPFPLEALGSFWASWCASAAESSGAPVDYVAATLLSCAAALLGNARRVSPWDGWVEPSILWIAIVGAPSAGKSPAIKKILPIIRRIEASAGRDIPEQLKEWEKLSVAARAAQERWEEEVRAAVQRKVPPPDKPQAAEPPHKPTAPRVLIGDATIEAVARLLARQPRGLLLHSDELARWIGQMDRYGGNGADRGFWLEAYDGGYYVVDRVKDGGTPINVPFHSVNVVGAIQPDRLAAGLLKDADDGLTGRFLWTWPTAIPPRRPTSLYFGEPAAFDALAPLAALEMRQPVDPTAGPMPEILALNSAAADCFHRFRQEHFEWEKTRTGLLASLSGKMPGQLLRLALVIEHLHWGPKSATTPPPRSVSLIAIEAAITLIEYFKAMAERVFADAAVPQPDLDARTIAQWLLKARPTVVNARDLRRRQDGPGIRDAKRMDEALRALVEAGWLELAPDRAGDVPGRTRKDYRVNAKALIASVQADPRAVAGATRH